MQYICLGYIEPGKFEGMTEDERHADLARCALLSAGLHPNTRKSRVSGTPACGARKRFFLSYPALTPQRAGRASGTHWANFATRLTALIIVALCGMAVLECHGASCTSAAEAGWVYQL